VIDLCPNLTGRWEPCGIYTERGRVIRYRDAQGLEGLAIAPLVAIVIGGVVLTAVTLAGAKLYHSVSEIVASFQAGRTSPEATRQDLAKVLADGLQDRVNGNLTDEEFTQLLDVLRAQLPAAAQPPDLEQSPAAKLISNYGPTIAIGVVVAVVSTAIIKSILK
jgi:hypothetical protein